MEVVAAHRVATLCCVRTDVVRARVGRLHGHGVYIVPLNQMVVAVHPDGEVGCVVCTVLPMMRLPTPDTLIPGFAL